MKRSLLVLLCTTLPLAAQQPAVPSRPDVDRPPALESIVAKDLARWAGFLASDELGGRLTGTTGQESAARYIADHFRSLGLEPLGDEVPVEDPVSAPPAAGAGSEPSSERRSERGYFQRYPVHATSVAGNSFVRVGAGTKARDFGTGFAVVPGRDRAGLGFTGEFVYAGRAGVRSHARGIEREDWTGAIPVIVLDEPEAGGLGVERQLMMGMARISAMRRRVERFARAGAPAVLFCILDGGSAVSDSLAYVSVAPGQPLLRMKGAFGMGQMMTTMQGPIPAIYAGPKLARALLESIGLTPAEAAARVTDEALQALASPKGAIELAVKEDDGAKASNVVAILRGSDPELADEAIVFSAHMDHVGRRVDGDVFNGADDNASGSAGLMAIAQAFRAAGKTRRSIIFLAVSGEELGLWGSGWFAKHSPWPIDDIVANINTDMIGRSGPESGPMQVTVTPSHKHNKFSTLVRLSARIAGGMGIEFSSGDKYYTRSDHFNFAKEGIPVVFFCNGEHEDYHQVSDHADKLDPAKMERIARLAYWTGYVTAQEDERPRELGRSDAWIGEDR